MTRYDWRIDGPPAQQGAATLGDVTCCVQVGVQAQAASHAREYAPNSRTPLPAQRAVLARVFRRDKHHAPTDLLTFVRKEKAELAKRPTPELAVERPPIPTLLPNGQGLQGQHVEVQAGNAFGNSVVAVGLKPSLLSRQAHQMTLGRTSACGLQPRLEESIPSLDASQFLGVEKPSATRNGDVDDPTVKAEHHRINDVAVMLIGQIHHEVDNRPTGDHPKPQRGHVSVDVSSEVIRKNERNANTTLDGGQGELARLEERGECALIEAGGGHRALLGQASQALAPEHVVRTIPSALDERRLKARPSRSGFVIAKSLKVLLRVRLGLEAEFEEEVAAFVELADSLRQHVVRREVECDRALHSIRNARRYLRLHGGGAKQLWRVRDRPSHHVVRKALRRPTEMSSRDKNTWVTCLAPLLAMTSGGASEGVTS